MKMSQFLLLVAGLLSSGVTLAGLAGDGCYHMTLPGADAGVICISGGSNESLSGEGAIVALGETTSQVSWCGKTSSMQAGNQSMTYNFGSRGSFTFIGNEQRGKLVIVTAPNVRTEYNYSANSQIDGTQILNNPKCRSAR